MAEKSSSAAKHWAVLIGVNFYPREEGGSISTKDCLQGAVTDVQAMQQYLEDAPYPVNIEILTATVPDDPTSTEPEELSKFWPNRDNVAQSLKKVRDAAKEGDFVYIHFSGHGTKLSSGASHSASLALVLFGEQPNYRSHLKGENLRFCLKDMVQKGLLVTVVLDCCFSGSVLRNSPAVGTSIRELKYDTAIDDAFPSELWTSLFEHGHTYREAELQHAWLINPEGYTILAACGLDETAHELQSSTGERLGGLTQFLVRALTDLRRRDVTITQESLYNHICARFKAAWGAQTPRLYGKRGLSFFSGLQTSSTNPLVPIFWRKDLPSAACGQGERRLYLRAGAAHGVSRGDTYDAYPLGSESGMSVRLRVHLVHNLHSEMVGFESATPVNHVQDGWNAELVSSESNHKITIRITEEAYSYAKNSVRPDRLHFVRLQIGNKDEEACQFNVKINHTRQYCIYDGSMELLPHVPPLSINMPNDDIHLLYILQRLASYKYLESVGVENTEGLRIQRREQTLRNFYDSFTLEAFADESETNRQGPEGPFHIKHDNYWSLNVENRSNETLYLAIFSFTSSWKIEDLTDRTGNNSFEEIQPSTETRQRPIRLKMKVPEGQTSCKDVIKVFITNRPTLFPALNLNKDLMDHPRTRSAEETVQSGIGGISAFLTALTGLYRESSGIEQKGIEHEAWATQNYIIYTSLVS